MLRSMTGFGRYFLEEGSITQTWEIRSVNSRHLDLKWKLPQNVRSLETPLEKVVRKYASRGRVEISLSMKFAPGSSSAVHFNQDQAGAMLDALEEFAVQRGDAFTPNYNQMLSLSYLWEDSEIEMEGEMGSALEKGLALALADWNEAREAEAKALEKDLRTRVARMSEWVRTVMERAPQIKEERFTTLQERLTQALEEHGQSLEEGRFYQEITILADKLDVSEEITRLNSHLDRLLELLSSGEDAGRRLDFTMQECFREINTCGNKIQDSQISRLIVDFKNELEKCREQVQNLE